MHHDEDFVKVIDEDDDLDDNKEEIKAKELYKKAEIVAKKYVDCFFADKMMHCGGKIPNRLLHDPLKINNIINYNICRAVKMAYKMMKKTITQEEIQLANKMGDSTKDIKLVNEILRMCAVAKIPKQFAGGILIMYLQYVEGIE